VLRWLLVLATLVGMGLWQGAHCPGEMIAVAHAHEATTEHPAQQAADTGSGPVAGLDGCDVVRATAVRTVVEARAPLPSGAGVLTVAAAPRPVRNRLVPAVTLATIGVCRT
jgi:hypothetical protein